MTTHRYTPRTHSTCCRARVVAQRCSECGKAAPWRTRLTEEEAEMVTARLTWPVVRYAPAQEAAGKATLYGYDD